MAPRLLLLAALAGSATPGANALMASRNTDSDCKCMNWEMAYEKHVNCGDGLEKYAHRDMDQDEYDVNVCQRFFTRLSDSSCVNIGMHNKANKKTNGQWCYVSRRCNNLNGGKIVDDTRAAWKRCGANDEQLRDLDPDDVATRAQDLNMDVATMLKMAYPVWEGNKWSEVREFFVKDVKKTTVGQLCCPPNFGPACPLDPNIPNAGVCPTGEHCAFGGEEGPFGGPPKCAADTSSLVAKEEVVDEEEAVDETVSRKLEALKQDDARPMVFLHPRGEDGASAIAPGLAPTGEDGIVLSVVWGKKVWHVLPTSAVQQYSPATWHELVCVQGC